jgi:serine/threonine-protein kinase
VSDSVSRSKDGPKKEGEDDGQTAETRRAPALAPGALATMRPPGLGGARPSPTPPKGPVELSDPPSRISVEVDVPMPSVRPEPLPAAPAASSGVQFGRYEVLGRLATGGMAEIFLALERTSFGATRQVVIKLARASFSDTAAFDEMFMNEGRVQLVLTHPNICHVYEFGKERGRHFIAMELVNGVSLRDLVRRAHATGKQLPVSLILRVGAQVAEALDFAHRARDARSRPLQIVHRDVSPHNVMISYDGTVKLLDFGVATGHETKSTTQSGTVKGKFNYMSPEQCTSGLVDARTDVFALGVCMWEALAGRLLFKRETQYETFRAIIEEKVPPLSKIRSDVPAELDAILAQAMAKNPDDRHLTAGELQDDLENLLSKQPGLMNASRVARYVQPLFAEEIVRGPELDTSPEIFERLGVGAAGSEKKPARRARWLPLGLALGAAVVALAALIIAIARQPDDVTPALTPAPAPPATVAVEPEAIELPPAPEPDPVPERVREPVDPTTADERLASDESSEEASGEEEDRDRSARGARRGSPAGRTMRARTMRGETAGFLTDPGF